MCSATMRCHLFLEPCDDMSSRRHGRCKCTCRHKQLCKIWLEADRRTTQSMMTVFAQINHPTKRRVSSCANHSQDHSVVTRDTSKHSKQCQDHGRSYFVLVGRTTTQQRSLERARHPFPVDKARCTPPSLRQSEAQRTKKGMDTCAELGRVLLSFSTERHGYEGVQSTCIFPLGPRTRLAQMSVRLGTTAPMSEQLSQHPRFHCSSNCKSQLDLACFVRVSRAHASMAQ